MKTLYLTLTDREVRAVLAGEMTQVREPAPIFLPGHIAYLCYERHPFHTAAFKGTVAEGMNFGCNRMAWVAYDGYENAVGVCELSDIGGPAGFPQDILRVRETWQRFVAPNGQEGVAYRASCVDGAFTWSNENEFAEIQIHRWAPPSAMPRWASRLSLRVTGLRLCRLQDITEDEARLSGVKPMPHVAAEQRIAGDLYERTQGTHPHTLAFASLWDGGKHLAAKQSWATNPAVFVRTFEVVR